MLNARCCAPGFRKPSLAMPLSALAERPHVRDYPFDDGVGNPAYWSLSMMTFVLWLLLLVFCWPLALLAIVLYPIVWLLLLPFRLVGFAVEGVFELLRAVILLPSRVLGGGKVATR